MVTVSRALDARLTIHGRYNTAYREAATLPKVFAYLSKKHSWPPDTGKTIHWEWLTKAFGRNRPSSTVTLTKLVYNQLATQQRKAVTGRDKWINPTCPHCIDIPETFQHMIRCKHPAAQKFRDNVLHSILAICHARRAPEIIQQTFHSWISQWLQFQTPTRQNLDPRLLPLYDAQAAIGWDLMIRGFLASEWISITATFYPTRPMPYNHDFLFPKLISDIWQHQLDFWTAYQALRHNVPDTPTDSTHALSEIQAQVRYIYTLGDKVLQTQRSRLFPDDLDQFLLNSTIAQLTNYITVYYPAIRLSIRQAKHRSRHSTRTLSSNGFTSVPQAQPYDIPPVDAPPVDNPQEDVLLPPIPRIQVPRQLPHNNSINVSSHGREPASRLLHPYRK